jgi:hypothetical protein
LRDTGFKYNCNLILIDFFWHGLLPAYVPDFFPIVAGLRRLTPEQV